MKNLLKVSALAIALLGTANVASAQASLNQTLVAHANVLTDISVTGTDFTFGNVYRNAGPVSVNELGASAGHFVILGTALSNVVATFAAPSNLNSSSTSGSLPVTWAYGSISAGTGACTSGFASGGILALDASGAGKICVGGTVSPVASTTPIANDYVGTVTITVAFP